MNIVLSGMKKLAYVLSIQYALEKLGHKVTVVDSQCFDHVNSYYMRKINKILSGKLSINFEQEWNKSLIKIIADENADMYMNVMGGIQPTKDTIKAINEMNVKTIAYILDGHVRLEQMISTLKSTLNLYDSLYTFDEDDVKYFRNEYNIDVQYMPVGYDSRYFYSEKDNKKREIDICFVGVQNDYRCKILENIAKYAANNNLKMHIQGEFYSNEHFWKRNQFKKKYPNIFRFLHNEWLDFENVGNLYRKSKICLNLVTENQKSINPRAFEIMACNAVQIMTAGQHKTILSGEEYVEYENVDDLIVKIDDILINYDKYCEGLCKKEKYSMDKILQKYFNVID